MPPPIQSTQVAIYRGLPADQAHLRSDIWRSQDAFATSLLVLFLDEFWGPDNDPFESLDWDPATMLLEVETSFRTEVLPENFEKLLCAIALLRGDSFTTSVVDFCKFCLTLSGEPGGFLPDAADCAWGLTEALLLAPPEDQDGDFLHPEIIGYLEQVVASEGLLNPPDILRLAVKDPEAFNKVKTAWSDDPDMLSAIDSMEIEKSQDIDNLIRSRMKSLLLQLHTLPLQRPGWSQRLQKVATRLLEGLERQDAQASQLS